MNRTVLYFCFFFGSFLCVIADVAPWTPVDWKTLPAASPDDQIEVRYLVAPLLEGSYGPLLGKFDLFHGALAFENLNTSASITLNYDADDFFRASLFPVISTGPDGNVTLIWENFGAAFVYLGINQTYWTEENSPLTIISGALYNKFMNEWNAGINQTNPYYNEFSVVSTSQSSYLDAWDCFDYVWSGVNFLIQNGANVVNETHHRNFVRLFSATPPILKTQDYNTDITVRNEINEFYELIQGKLGQLTIDQILFEIYAIYEGNIFVRYNSDYYQIQLTWPILHLDWLPLPFTSSN